MNGDENIKVCLTNDHQKEDLIAYFSKKKRCKTNFRNKLLFLFSKFSNARISKISFLSAKFNELRK